MSNKKVISSISDSNGAQLVLNLSQGKKIVPDNVSNVTCKVVHFSSLSKKQKTDLIDVIVRTTKSF